MISIIMLVILFILVIGGVQLAFALILVAVIFGITFMGMTVFYMFPLTIFGVMQNEILIAIPLFVFMGTILEKTGMAEQAYEDLHKLFGPVRGGLAVATVISGALFAMATGVIAATVTIMTLMAVPSMLKRNYDKGLATGVVCAGGSLGILIPPSVMLLMYGPMANISVSNLFAAAFLPGFLLAFLYISYILIRCWLQPTLAPAISSVELGSTNRYKLLLHTMLHMLPVFLLIVAVMGSIIGGIASPTEASAVGALASMLIAIGYHKLNFQNVKNAAQTALIISSMVFFIIFAAGMFDSVFLYLGGGAYIKSMLIGLPLGRWFVLFIMMFILFILGFFISWQGLLYVVVPIFLPVATTLGFNPLWFAILVAVNLQMSFLTPPFAYAIFFVKGSAPPEITTVDIYRGVIPFVILQMIGLILIIIFPSIVLWLPHVALGA